MECIINLATENRRSKINIINKNYVRYFALILIIISIFVVSTIATTKVNNIITIATAIFGLLIVLYQLSRDHKIKKAEFIYSLNTTFNSDSDISVIYMSQGDQIPKKERRDVVDSTFSMFTHRRSKNYRGVSIQAGPATVYG